MILDSRGYQLRDRLIQQLHSSLYLPDVLDRAQLLLPQLIPTDYMGLCIVTPQQPIKYEWMGTGRPVALLEQYPAMVDKDFVLESVSRRTDVVLRDSEMLSRKELERSLFYQVSRELGLGLEHVMAVLLSVSQGVYGGFTLYRDRRRPFSEHSLALLQGLVPHLVNAIRNCREMATASTGARLLEELYQRQGAAFLVLEPPAYERMRSLRTTTLLEKWFTRSDFHSSGIPQVLVDRVAKLMRTDADERLLENTWEQSNDQGRLAVKFVELPAQDGPRPWVLILHEFSHSIPLPETLAQQLTARQREVAEGLLSNWSNELIAEHLHLSVATVKTHVRDIFRELQIDSRADLMYQAARLLKPI